MKNIPMSYNARSQFTVHNADCNFTGKSKIGTECIMYFVMTMNPECHRAKINACSSLSINSLLFMFFLYYLIFLYM